MSEPPRPVESLDYFSETRSPTRLLWGFGIIVVVVTAMQIAASGIWWFSIYKSMPSQPVPPRAFSYGARVAIYTAIEGFGLIAGIACVALRKWARPTLIVWAWLHLICDGLFLIDWLIEVWPHSGAATLMAYQIVVTLANTMRSSAVPILSVLLFDRGNFKTYFLAPIYHFFVGRPSKD